MSSLAFQKHLRLQEARRLMRGEALDAARAGYRVGDNDASHFSRDYKRLFSATALAGQAAAVRATGASMLDGMCVD